MGNPINDAIVALRFPYISPMGENLCQHFNAAYFICQGENYERKDICPFWIESSSTLCAYMYFFDNTVFVDREDGRRYNGSGRQGCLLIAGRAAFFQGSTLFFIDFHGKEGFLCCIHKRIFLIMWSKRM